MGQPQSKAVKPAKPIKPARPTALHPNKDSSTWKDSWQSTRKGILGPFGYAQAPIAAAEIPPDNIFVPIQADNILPQVPIGRHHPVPRKGVEDNEDRTMNTNKFYANAFLGDQNQPIWTHPYSVSWGKGWDEKEPGLVKTWGMCVSHIEESDLGYGPGDPTNVRK
jgi:endo-1,3(4)-beta-glucanase